MSQMNRSELPANAVWKPEHIYADQSAFEIDIEWVQEQLKELSALLPKFKEGGKATVLQGLKLFSRIIERGILLYSYAQIVMNTDNGNSEGQALCARAGALFVKVQTVAASLSPTLLALPRKTVKAYIEDPDFADFDKLLIDTERMRSHTLSKEVESLLASAGEVFDAPSNIYQMLSEVDMKLGKVRDEEGKTVELTNALYASLLESSNRSVRKNAFERMLKTYNAYGSTYAASYSAAVKKDVFNARAHGFSSAREAALYPAQIPESVYDNLIAAVHDALPVLNAYCELRKTALNLPSVHLYDLYVPMVKEAKMTFSYDEAYEKLLKAIEPLGKDYQKVVREAKEAGWIDIYETPNKTTGAYSNGSAYSVHPYILLNYRPELDGLLTLAHEMGHAMHSYYSNHTQPFAKSDYTIFVAEVASTCNEVLTIQSLRKQYADNKAIQAMLIGRLLEGFRTTVFRQTMFAEFEMKAHIMEETGEPLTRETLSAMYYQLNKQYYGKSCTVDKLIANEWMRIPHFYMPFYVYQYATGFCAAVALADNILNGGEEAVKAYRTFLTLGDSMSPIEELKIAGVDMSTTEPVTHALDVFAELLTDFCEMIG